MAFTRNEIRATADWMSQIEAEFRRTVYDIADFINEYYHNTWAEAFNIYARQQWTRGSHRLYDLLSDDRVEFAPEREWDRDVTMPSSPPRQNSQPPSPQ